jgi:hypothetical protein
MDVFIFLYYAGFYGEEMSASSPSLKLDDHPLSAVQNA